MPGAHTWNFWEQEIRYAVMEWMPEKEPAPVEHTMDF